MIPTIEEEGVHIVAIYKELYELLSETTKKTLEDDMVCLSCSKNFTIDGCSCGSGINHPLLEYFHERNFGSSGTFWGLYVVDFENLKTISKKIDKDILRNKQSSPSLFRREFVGSSGDVQNWIDSTFPDNNLVVKEISIPCSPPPKPKQKKLFEIFESCFRGSETKLHGYLKWFSYTYLSKGESFYFQESITSFGIAFEVKYSLPGNRLIKQYKGGKGSVVPNSWSLEWDWSSCILKIADVYFGGNRVIVECGATDSMSLVAPIQAKISKRVIWLPYPQGMDKYENLQDFDEILPAYLIHTKQPKHLRWCIWGQSKNSFAAYRPVSG